MSTNTVSGAHMEEDHDLQTILALYDSSDLLTKLEEAVKVLTEMIPSGIVEHEELLDDALAVVCGDLCQILELGIKDPTLSTLLVFLREMGPTTHKIQEISQNLNLGEGNPLPRPAVDPAKREVLFAEVIDLFKLPASRQTFLTFLEEESSLSDLYLSFAPLRNETDCKRICRVLRSLPQISPTGSARLEQTLEEDLEVLKAGDVKVQEAVPEVVLNSPEKLEEKLPHSPGFNPRLRSKPISHTRSRSNLDHIALSRTMPSRRLSFSRESTPVSLPEPNLQFSPSYFSPPRPGQSLIGYLQSQDTETCADLERENAHFFVSDVIIAAVEQMQYERRHASERGLDVNGATASASDEDVGLPSASGSHHESPRSPVARTPLGLMRYKDIVSDGQSSSAGTTSGSLDEEDDVLSFPLLQTPSSEVVTIPAVIAPLETPPNNDRRSSASFLRESHWRGRGSDHPSNSAEAIAITLLRKFKEHHLPKATEMEWLVSESDVPQSLLPLPNSTFIFPDSAQPASSGSSACRIRGNLDWAPLRPQIIYHIQPHLTLKVGIVNQKNRCAGCGGKMDAYQQARMRFCEYTGKFFCVCCHEYKTSLIPARVLLKWDFTKHYVSNFAADFIARIFRDPLFDVSDCNMELYRKSKSMMQTRLIRTQLVLATEYLRTCRQAQNAMGEVEQLPKFVWEHIHIYSLDLFCSVKDGVFPTFIKPVAELAVQHVVSCQFCSSKGFICEFCRDSTPLFPFQLKIAFQCGKCFSCFHINCIKKKACPKCARQQARKAAAPAGVATC